MSSIASSRNISLRPFLNTESAVPVERGKSRLELGARFERFKNDESGYALLAELTYGIINNLDFEVEFPYQLDLSMGQYGRI